MNNLSHRISVLPRLAFALAVGLFACIPGASAFEGGLKSPASLSTAAGLRAQGLQPPRLYDGALDRMEPLQQGFYYSGLRSGTRLGLHASEMVHGLHTRLSASWYAQVEAGITRGESLAPAYALTGRVQTLLSPGWQLSLGLRYSMRDAADASTFYPSAESAAATPLAHAQLGPAARAGASALHYRLELHYRYGTRNSSLGLELSSGRQADEFMPHHPLMADDSRQFSLVGNHWLNQDWAVNYGIAPGELNRRQGLRLGLRYLF